MVLQSICCWCLLLWQSCLLTAGDIKSRHLATYTWSCIQLMLQQNLSSPVASKQRNAICKPEACLEQLDRLLHDACFTYRYLRFRSSCPETLKHCFPQKCHLHSQLLDPDAQQLCAFSTYCTCGVVASVVNQCHSRPGLDVVSHLELISETALWFGVNKQTVFIVELALFAPQMMQEPRLQTCNQINFPHSFIHSFVQSFIHSFKGSLGQP